MNELVAKLFGTVALGAIQAGAAVEKAAEGIGKAYDLAQSSPVINDMANHGRSELVAALFGGQSNAHVMYMRGGHDQPQENEQQQDLPVKQSCGMSM